MLQLIFAIPFNRNERRFTSNMQSHYFLSRVVLLNSYWLLYQYTTCHCKLYLHASFIRHKSVMKLSIPKLKYFYVLDKAEKTANVFRTLRIEITRTLIILRRIRTTWSWYFSIATGKYLFINVLLFWNSSPKYKFRKIIIITTTLWLSFFKLVFYKTIRVWILNVIFTKFYQLSRNYEIPKKRKSV